MQNCFGLGNVTCKTGVRVTGTNPDNGQPITAISDKSPDVNGIEEFCTDPKYVQYCNSGQIRVLYVNETESNGPCQAQYMASKLWGGETYYMQGVHISNSCTNGIDCILMKLRRHNPIPRQY